MATTLPYGSGDDPSLSERMRDHPVYTLPHPEPLQPFDQPERTPIDDPSEVDPIKVYPIDPYPDLINSMGGCEYGISIVTDAISQCYEQQVTQCERNNDRIVNTIINVVETLTQQSQNNLDVLLTYLQSQTQGWINLIDSLLNQVTSLIKVVENVSTKETTTITNDNRTITDNSQHNRTDNRVITNERNVNEDRHTETNSTRTDSRTTNISDIRIRSEPPIGGVASPPNNVDVDVSVTTSERGCRERVSRDREIERITRETTTNTAVKEVDRVRDYTSLIQTLTNTISKEDNSVVIREFADRVQECLILIANQTLVAVVGGALECPPCNTPTEVGGFLPSRGNDHEPLLPEDNRRIDELDPFGREPR